MIQVFNMILRNDTSTRFFLRLPDPFSASSLAMLSGFRWHKKGFSVAFLCCLSLSFAMAKANRLQWGRDDTGTIAENRHFHFTTEPQNCTQPIMGQCFSKGF
jgi:hypothetical protein